MDLLVPVHDTQSKAFDFKHLYKLDKILPSWDDKVPAGSFAVVNYTASTYKKIDGAKHTDCSISLNVQWVVILGSP